MFNSISGENTMLLMNERYTKQIIEYERDGSVASWETKA